MAEQFDRRKVLGGLGAGATLAALPAAPANAAARTPIDFSNDVDNVKAYAKLAGRVDDGMVHYWYTGTIYGVTKEATKAMLGWTGLLKMVWRNLGNGSFHYRNYDLAYFTLPGSDERIEEFENPFTGKINRPIDVTGGPFDVVIAPKQYEHVRAGDDIWFAEAKHFRFKNKLDPAEWPNASTGEMLNMLYVDGFQGKVSDLENEEIVGAPSQLSVNHVNPWYPFFLMGKWQGVNYWHGMGKKVFAESDITPAVLAHANTKSPGFLESTAPWVQRTDSYLDYKMQRKPVTD